MGDRNRRTGSLTIKSRVSKETKLRLRVVFLDDSERTFEVEVSPSTTNPIIVLQSFFIYSGVFIT